MSAGEIVDFSPELFQVGDWLDCSLENNEVSGRIIKKLASKKYLLETPLFTETVSSQEVDVKRRTKNNIYNFKGVLASNSSEQKGDYTLKIESRGQKIQTQSSKRIAIYQSIQFTVIKKPLFAGKRYEGQIEDISGSGAKLITTFKLIPTNVIKIHCEFDNFPLDNLEARVVRSNQVYGRRHRIYEIGVGFNCSEQAKNQIINYIKGKEMEYKLQGLL